MSARSRWWGSGRCTCSCGERRSIRNFCIAESRRMHPERERDIARGRRRAIDDLVSSLRSRQDSADSSRVERSELGTLARQRDTAATDASGRRRCSLECHLCPWTTLLPIFLDYTLPGSLMEERSKSAETSGRRKTQYCQAATAARPASAVSATGNESVPAGRPNRRTSSRWD